MIVIKNILVATDFSEPSESAVQYALALARTFSSTLHVIHIADDLAARAAFSAAPVFDFGQLQTDLEDEAHRNLNAIVCEDDRRTLNAHLLVFTSTSPAETILSYASGIL